mgnify:CR=1 FL=1
MTIREAQAIARENGYTLRKTECGEYRFNIKGGEEATAYYASDLDDAIKTIRLEAHRQWLNQDVRLKAAQAETGEEVKPEITLTVREQSNFGNIVYYPASDLGDLFASVAGTETLTDRTLSLVAQFGRDADGKITGDVGYKIEIQRPTPNRTWITCQKRSNS